VVNTPRLTLPIWRKIDYSRQTKSVFNPSSTDIDAKKNIIRVGNKSAVFSYTDNNTYMACLMSFIAPTYMGDNVLNLDVSFSHKTLQKTLGSDIYVYTNDMNGWSWKQIGSTNTRFGDEGIFFDRYPVTSSTFYDDPYDRNSNSLIYVLIVSKYPQFTSARGLLIPGDIPEDDLSKTYTEIFDQYTDSNDRAFDKDSLIKTIDYGSNNGFYNILYARLVGTTGSQTNDKSQYIEGIDYIYDSTNDRIELLDNTDVYDHMYNGFRATLPLKGYNMPKIGYHTDIFTSVGAISPDSPGKFNDGTPIVTDSSDADFNFKFALSKIPYHGMHMVYATIEKETIDTTEDISIDWDSDAEYGASSEYMDNKIKSTTGGNGCYIASINDTISDNKWLLNTNYKYIGDETQVVYNDGTNDVIKLDSFPAINVPSKFVDTDPDGHTTPDEGVIRLYNNTTSQDLWTVIDDVTEGGVITVDSGWSLSDNILVGYYIESGDYISGTVSITYPYLMDNGYDVKYIENVDGFVFSKTLFEHNTYDPSFQLSNRDVLTIGTQIDVKWPKDKEPYLDIEEEDE